MPAAVPDDPTRHHPHDDPEQVFATESGSLRNWLRSRTGDAAVADDLTSETFLRAIDGWDGFRGEASRRSWLWRIAHHTLSNWRRARSRDRSVATDDPPTDTEPPPDELEERAAVWELLSLIPTSRGRTTVYLRYVEGLSAAEIGERLDLSPTAVRTLTHRSLERLRERLAEKDPS